MKDLLLVLDEKLNYNEHVQSICYSLGGRVTRLLVTFRGSQLDKLRLFLAATGTVHVNIVVIINCNKRFSQMLAPQLPVANQRVSRTDSRVCYIFLNLKRNIF